MTEPECPPNSKEHTYYDFFTEFFGGNFFEDYFEGTISREKKFEIEQILWRGSILHKNKGVLDIVGNFVVILNPFIEIRKHSLMIF